MKLLKDKKTPGPDGIANELFVCRQEGKKAASTLDQCLLAQRDNSIKLENRASDSDFQKRESHDQKN